jgi:hypothetical protein
MRSKTNAVFIGFVSLLIIAALVFMLSEWTVPSQPPSNSEAPAQVRAAVENEPIPHVAVRKIEPKLFESKNLAVLLQTSSGIPVQGAACTLLDGEGHTLSQQAGFDGRVLFETVSDGLVKIDASHPCERFVSAEVPIEGNNREIVLTASPWGGVEVSVVDSEDIPLPGISVTASGPRFPVNGIGAVAEFVGITDHAGKVHVDRLDLSETYQIVARSASGISFPMYPRYVTPTVPHTSLRIVLAAMYGARVRFLDRETRTVLGEAGNVGYSWRVEWPHKPYAWQTAAGVNRIAVRRAFDLPEDAETFLIIGVVNQPYAKIPPDEGAVGAIVRGNFRGFGEAASSITIYSAQKIMAQPVQDVYCDRNHDRVLVRCRMLDKSGTPIKRERIGFAWATDEAREWMRSKG